MIKKSLCVLSLASFMMADTTMCFKKDWMDPSTIETTTLDGGKCASSKSLVDMKADGWMVDDIKISSGDAGMNFMYILKKGSYVNSSNDNNNITLTKEGLREKLLELQEEQKVKKVKEDKISSLAAGKKLYNSTCKSCHADGTISAYNTARPLLEIGRKDFEISINDYVIGNKKGSMSILMKPYASLMTHKDIENVYNYLQTIKK